MSTTGSGVRPEKGDRPDAKELVDTFCSRYPKLASVGGAANQCAIASHEFIRIAGEAGVAAQVIWLRGERAAAAEDSSRAPRQASDEHAVVLLDGLVLDFTRRQIAADAEFPTVYTTVEDAARDWNEVNLDTDRNAPWQELPSHRDRS